MTDATPRGFTLTRTINAPRERVFAAWTEPAELDWFFSDPGAHNPAAEVDLRAGGEWRQLMVIDELDSYVTGGRYRLVVPGEKLVFAWGAEGGWPELDDDAPVVTVALVEIDGHTEMTVTVSLPETLTQEQVGEQLATGMEAGWNQTVDRLVAQLAGATS